MNTHPILCLTLFSVCIALTGCNQPDATKHAADSHAPGTHVHADGTVHANHGPGESGHSHDNPPHGGTILDWGGGKYHLELLVDHGNQKATVYVLGPDVKNDLPIDAGTIQVALKDPVVEFTLSAQPQDGDPQGKSSLFVGQHEALAAEQQFEGTIHGTIGGTPYSGDFMEK